MNKALRDCDYLEHIEAAIGKIQRFLFVHWYPARQILERPAFALGPRLGVGFDTVGVFKQKRLQITKAQSILVEETGHAVAILQWQMPSEDDPIKAAQNPCNLGLMQREKVLHGGRPAAVASLILVAAGGPR